MTASPLVAKINQASKDVWPQVSAGVDQTMRSLYELAQISEAVVPRVEEYVARGKSGSLRRRKVCEETIWVLASLGWLRTGGERDVILAAKSVVDTFNDPNTSDDECAKVEDELVSVVDSLPEYMTTPKES